jgi:hypothetical protein
MRSITSSTKSYSGGPQAPTLVVPVLGQAQRFEPRGIGVGGPTVAGKLGQQIRECSMGIEKDWSASVHSASVLTNTNWQWRANDSKSRQERTLPA